MPDDGPLPGAGRFFQPVLSHPTAEIRLPFAESHLWKKRAKTAAKSAP